MSEQLHEPCEECGLKEAGPLLGIDIVTDAHVLLCPECWRMLGGIFGGQPLETSDDD